MGGMPDIPAQPAEKSVYTYDNGELVSSKEVQGDKIVTKQVLLHKNKQIKNKDKKI